MKIRWLLIALGLAVAMTVIAWLPIHSTRDIEDVASGPSDRATGSAGTGCSANAKPANLGFTLKDMYGRDVRLADYKGKVLMINFWATWCGPCQLEIPGFVDLQAKYKKRGFEIVGISINDEANLLPPFAREYKVNYPLLVGLGRDDVMEAYGPIMGVPVTLLVGRDGRVCYKKVGLADLDVLEQEIKNLL